MQNFITELNKLTNNINIEYYILQEKTEDRIGYIYIKNWHLLTDAENDYVEKNIYPFLIDNGWEHFFYLSDEEFDLQDILKLFPIIEN